MTIAMNIPSINVKVILVFATVTSTLSDITSCPFPFTTSPNFFQNRRQSTFCPFGLPCVLLSPEVSFDGRFHREI